MQSVVFVGTQIFLIIFIVMWAFVKVRSIELALFSIFLNDLVYFILRAYKGLIKITQDIHFFHKDEIETYFKLYRLLYADDTVILEKSAQQLQDAPNFIHI